MMRVIYITVIQSYKITRVAYIDTIYDERMEINILRVRNINIMYKLCMTLYCHVTVFYQMEKLDFH